MALAKGPKCGWAAVVGQEQLHVWKQAQPSQHSGAVNIAKKLEKGVCLLRNDWQG